MKENIIKIKSFDFALLIIKLNRYLIDEKKEYVLSKQILRAGTSIGANIRESEHSESVNDFIHRLSVVLKEANETDYWIDLLFQSHLIDNEKYSEIKSKIEEILKLLVSIIKTTKKNHLNM